MPEITDTVEMQWRYIEETGDTEDCGLQALRVYRQLREPLELFQDFVVLIHTDANVTQYLAKQRTHDHLCAVIRDNDYSPFGVSEGVVTTMPPLPLKTTALSYLA